MWNFVFNRPDEGRIMEQVSEASRAKFEELLGILKIEYVKGEQFIPIKQAAKFAGIHQVALDMANYLMPRAGSEAARFKLGTPEMKENAESIYSMLMKDLQKAIKLLMSEKDGDFRYRVKTLQMPDVLVFWLEKRKRQVRKKK